jgi:hypothetical protein
MITFGGPNKEYHNKIRTLNLVQVRDLLGLLKICMSVADIRRVQAISDRIEADIKRDESSDDLEECSNIIAKYGILVKKYNLLRKMLAEIDLLNTPAK